MTSTCRLCRHAGQWLRTDPFWRGCTSDPQFAQVNELFVPCTVKRRSPLSPDTLIGVFMALTLGLGVCLLVAATKTFNIHQIEGLMFGSLLTVTDVDLLLLVGASVLVGGVIAWR